jgi:hypothetical protein
MIIRRFLRLGAIVLALLSIPFIGMQLSTEIRWSNTDFAIAAIGLFGAGIAYEIIRAILVTPRQRMITGIGIVVIMCICWVELAVGVFGTPFAGS